MGKRYDKISLKPLRADSHNDQVLTSGLQTHSANNNLKGSRRVESGMGILDNNGVNVLMALIMSVGGMLIMKYVWDLPLESIIV